MYCLPAPLGAVAPPKKTVMDSLGGALAERIDGPRPVAQAALTR